MRKLLLGLGLQIILNTEALGFFTVENQTGSDLFECTISLWSNIAGSNNNFREENINIPYPGQHSLDVSSMGTFSFLYLTCHYYDKDLNRKIFIFSHSKDEPQFFKTSYNQVIFPQHNTVAQLSIIGIDYCPPISMQAKYSRSAPDTQNPKIPALIIWNQ